MISEMWRFIEGYEGLYEINEHAVIRRAEDLELNGKRFAGHVLAVARTQNGMKSVALWKNGRRKTHMVHKLYAASFHISENEAARRLYRGFRGKADAMQNVRHMLLTSLSACEKEQARGIDRHDEILYFKQFLDELKNDTIGGV